MIPVLAYNQGFEEQLEGAFSHVSNIELEGYIQRFISGQKSLTSRVSKNLVREFLLYGFLKATGQEFVSQRHGRYVEEGWDDPMWFGVENGVLALSDDKGELWIRGAESYQNGNNRHDTDCRGVEGTLLALV